MAAVQTETLVDRAAAVLSARRLADADTPAMLMVSGGSDSTALAYIACELRERGALGQLAMLHVNHRLRGEDADEDARFVAQLAELLDVPLFSCEIDIAGEAQRTGENVEAVARRERYLAANEALEASLAWRHRLPMDASDGAADDRVESFYMRSIVGTGRGFRAMKYRNGRWCAPAGCESQEPGLLPSANARRARGLRRRRLLWREDATSAHRPVQAMRHEIVRGEGRNPASEVLAAR
ncbi:MAG: ATP-binding protein [Eggerthella lenta]